MPHDAVTLREDVIEKSVNGAGHDLVLQTRYEAPAGPDGEILYDPYAKMDLANQKWMQDILQKHYPGHFWATAHDGAHRVAYFSIPFLMGIGKYWAINLVTDELTEALLVRGGGQLLERYRLRRGAFHLAEFLEAREKHSRLLVPRRLIPE